LRPRNTAIRARERRTPVTFVNEQLLTPAPGAECARMRNTCGLIREWHAQKRRSARCYNDTV
jgi:hypothetical protein